MSKIHILAGDGGTYNLVIHTDTPTGINVVGNSWKAAYVAAHSGLVSSLPVGTAIGSISSSESAQVVSGDVLEFRASLNARPDGITPTTTQLTVFADAVITSEFSKLQVALKFYGYTQ